ncbi:FERONIA receptor-like kinase [Carex littledalei]|uniref:FERONIA receptor-like kinase n=1 Tax=Carex littledalei TaxID=544730 RepID=A0A833QNC9_9POAL|nr:FERONIA receptor-like kinase [Carex littledalei]
MTYISFLILIFPSLLFFHFTVPALATDSTLILLSCGTSGTIQDIENNRVWVGDIDSKYISQATRETLTIPYRDESVPEMSMAGNNLAGLNPVPIAYHTVDPSQAYGKMHHDSKRNVVAIIGGVASSVLLLFLLGGCICLFVIYKSQKKKERESEEEKRSDSTTMSIPAETNITSNSTTADSSNSFISASVATFHDARTENKMYNS